MTAQTPRNPPPQSPYYSNYQSNPVSPKNSTSKLPGVPEQSNGDETPAPTPPKKEQRLIVVSNRLPVTISKDANGEYQFAMSSGGLVSALSGCKKKMSFTWIGWPGKHIPVEDRAHVEKRLLEEYSCYPVYLPDDVAEQHYNGFSNSILWPLFHYHPGEMNFNADHWKAYREANMRFADVVAGMCSAGDMVWVQDYHLMLLPMLLRTMISGASSQGSMVQHELGRVKEGLDAAAISGALGLSKNEDTDEGVEMLEDVGEEEPLTIGNKPKTPVARLKRPGLQRGLSSFQQQEIKAKEKGKEGIRIGFFLHTPFPSSEIYRILPVRREILLGVLQCDLIGFHTYDYARHFLSSCTRILGLETEPNGIDFEGRFAQVGTFPIGIDPYAFVDAVKKPHIKERTRSLEAKFEGKKVIIGVDRLDYIKGLPQKLQSFEVFLSQNPEWVEKVVLVQLAIPSRQDVEEYQNLRACVNELVGKINGRFGTVDHTPIHYLHRSVPFDELNSMFAMSDACLITSTRDGMNLVAYEYISTQAERHGSLILSEFAGAAQSLAGSLIINPWDCQQTADSILNALTLSQEQRASNWDKLWHYVSKYTSEAWGTSFVNELTNLSGHRPSGPSIPGRKKSGSLSRASSRASMARRSSHGHSLNNARDARDVMT